MWCWCFSFLPTLRSCIVQMETEQKWLFVGTPIFFPVQWRALHAQSYLPAQVFRSSLSLGNLNRNPSNKNRKGVFSSCVSFEACFESVACGVVVSKVQTVVSDALLFCNMLIIFKPHLQCLLQSMMTLHYVAFKRTPNSQISKLTSTWLVRDLHVFVLFELCPTMCNLYMFAYICSMLQMLRVP